MKTLLESLDEKIFTDELKTELVEKFNNAVDEKAKIKAAELTEEKINEKMDELEEKFEEFKEILEDEYKENETQLVDQVDAYLEKIVDEFVSEAKESLTESIKSEKADMIIEAMESMIVTTGVDLMKISEAAKDTEKTTKYDEAVEKYDALIEENIQLQKENDKLLKLGIISEMKEGLSVVEAEKFEKLAGLVEFDKSEDYIEKLETIKESIINNNDKDDEVSKENKNITESKETKVKETKDPKDIIVSFSHLV